MENFDDNFDNHEEIHEEKPEVVINFNVVEYRDICIVSILTDNASLNISTDFKNLLVDLIANKAVAKFIIDFTEVTFADSSFFGAMVYAYRNAMEKKGKIKIFGLNDDLRMRFAITKLDTFLEIYESQEDAIDSFR